MESAGPKGLDGLLLLPKAPGKHPLVLMLHTHSDFHMWMSEQSPKEELPAADWFASRGWAVAIADPRGVGRSGGKWLTVKDCEQPSVDELGRHSAEDLEALFEGVRDNAEVDSTTVIVAADYMGAMGGLWWAAQAPKGLKAVLAFNLGPWMAGLSHCTERGIAAAYGAVAAQIKVPSLWVASEKGGILKGVEIREIHAAYTAGGGEAVLQFVPAPKDGEVETLGTKKENWSPVAEAFLAKQHLPATVLTPVPTVREAHLLGIFTPEADDALAQYFDGPPSKAFAVGDAGHYGWAIGRHDLKSAESLALDRCRHMTCHLVSVAE
jgi:pimeloyl-ACP methyl ester carboxylesterase